MRRPRRIVLEINSFDMTCGSCLAHRCTNLGDGRECLLFPDGETLGSLKAHDAPLPVTSKSFRGHGDSSWRLDECNRAEALYSGLQARIQQLSAELKVAEDALEKAQRGIS